MGERAYPLDLQLSPRRARIFFVRHGEPDVYGADTQLTEKGVQQVEDFAESFSNTLSGDKKSKLVKLLRSDRVRTAQTAKIIESRIREGVKAHEWVGVELKRNIPVRRFITPDNTIDAVIEAGVELRNAYRTWLGLSYDEARAMGAKWSGDVASEAFSLAGKLGGYIDEVREGPDLYYVLATHETTLGAILLHSAMEGAEHIDYAQCVEMEALEGDVLVKSGNDISVVHLRNLENGVVNMV